MSQKYRSRTHALLLYPDCESHVKAVDKIAQSYDYAIVLHNRDYFIEGDNKGEKKKDHWHVVLRFNQPVWSSAICKDLGIEENYIEAVKKFDNALMYLVHFNDTDKAQYSVNEVSGTLKRRLTECINKVDKSEGEKVFDLIDYIDKYDGWLTIKKFASYCAQEGYWAEFRRSATIFIKIIDEHNSKY